MKDILKNIIESNLADNHVLMAFNEGGKGNYIRIVIDSVDPITLGDTTSFAKKLRNSEEYINKYPDGIRLEVTTPGIGQPLEKHFQYVKNINRGLRIEYSENNEITSFDGKLVEVNEDSLKLLSKEENYILKFDQILSARVKIAFK